MKRLASRSTVVFVTMLILCAGALAAELAPMKVGEEEPISIGTLHPYPQGAGDDAREWTVHYPGATYIRMHFSMFDLAPGDHLVISNPEGTEFHTYTGKGPHGNGHFWAFTIVGDTAVLRLQAVVGGGGGFESDRFGRGTEPYFDPPATPESVCGAQDWLDVACYETSYPTEYAMARGAVKALIGATSACTAFKVSDSGQFMFNNHCTATLSGVQATELRFEYQNNVCGGGGSSYTGSVMGSDLLSTDYTLDYTHMTTTGDSSSIPCLALDNRLAPEGERIYIAHHPLGGVKKLSIESTYPSNPTGLCQVDNSPQAGRDATSDIGYYCDTTNGSSGSPVLSGDTHKVVAIHHYGGCLNGGVRMDRIYDKISRDLDTCSGGSECGNAECEPGENECNCEADCGAPASYETSCTDGADNDCDGMTDCDDVDCELDPACEVPTCLQRRDPCTENSQCCSGECKFVKKGGYCK